MQNELKKKICLIGAFAVGKTSLVRRFVHSIFSEKYHTTVGVMIDKKQVNVNGLPVDLIIWDLHGEDDFQSVRMSYLRGASGCFYVADGTRETRRYDRPGPNASHLILLCRDRNIGRNVWIVDALRVVRAHVDDLVVQPFEQLDNFRLYLIATMIATNGDLHRLSP